MALAAAVLLVVHQQYDVVRSLGRSGRGGDVKAGDDGGGAPGIGGVDSLPDGGEAGGAAFVAERPA